MTTPTLSNFSVPLKVLGNAPFTLTPPASNSSGAFTYTSSSPTVATVNSTTGVVTIVGQGSATITATQAAHGGFTSATEEATLIVLSQSPLNNPFSLLPGGPTLPANSGLSVSGKFKDFKRDVKFIVDINIPSSTMAFYKYSVVIDSLELDSDGQEYFFDTYSIPDSLGKRVEGSFSKSNYSIIRDNDKGFPFVDLNTYSIKHEVEIKETTDDGDNTATPPVPPTTVTHIFSHTQVFRYYENPVKLSDFSFDDNVALGDDLTITGLVLDHGVNSPVDPTEPEKVKFTFNRIDSNNTDPNIYFRSEQDFNAIGNYTIELPPSVNPQGFILGNSYSIRADASWELGYSTSKKSSQSLNLLNRPKITNIEVLPLSVDNNDDIMEITLAELSSSGSVDAPSKVWFEFYAAFDAGTWTNSNVVQLGGSGAPTLLGSSNTSNQMGSWSFSQATWVSPTVTNSNGTRTATYTGGTLTSRSFTGPVTITTTYGVDADGLPNTDIQFSIINPSNQAVIFSSVTLLSSLVPNSTNKTLTGTVAAGDALVARAGGDPEASGPGVTIPDSNIILLKLSDIDTINGVGLLNSIDYSVIAKIKYEELNPPVFRDSDPYEDVNFDLTTPTISSIDKNPLYIRNTGEEIATITVTHANYELIAPIADDATGGIEFVFYNASGTAEVARTKAYDFVNTLTESGTTPGTTPYPIKLSDITPGVLQNDIPYKVKAQVTLINHSGNTVTPELRLSAAFTSVTFALVHPVISSVTPYDVQNDGGADGVFHPNSTDVDSASQIVATVSINNAAYKLYAPSHIRFNIYNSSGTTKLAVTTERAFTNSLTVPGGTQLYDIELDDITILSGSALTNGTPYTVKAEVKLLDHDSTPNPEWRESDSFNVTFSQNIAPVPSVTISNSWALATNNNPSSSPSRFNGSPLVGISGYFMKTAQFGSSYSNSKQLDLPTTMFELKYRLNNQGNWNLVTKAVLIRQDSLSPSPNGTFRVDVGNAHAIALANNATFSANGQYPNVDGDRSLPIIFHIPQDQGSGNAFTESDTVEVRVTVIDTTGMWAPGNNTSPPTTSNSIRLINKIESYNFATGQASEPWNSATDDSKLYVHVNGNVVEVPRAQIKASSNNIIEELDEGFRIINTGVGTNGAAANALPKTTIYFYGNVVPAAQQTSSNSFQVNQINGMGAYAVIHQNAGAKEYPFFVTYTTPTASGNNALWYKSSVLYAPDAQNNQWNIGVGENPGDTVTNPSRVGLTLLYTGTDDPNFRPDIPASRRVKHVFIPQYSNANSTYATELVNLVSLQTSSNASASQAGNFNFTLSEAGLTTSSSVLSTLVMSFTKNLILNIPVTWNSEYSHSVKVGYKYDPSHSYIYRTFNAPAPTNPPTNPPLSSTVELYVEPTRATTLYYSVAYIVNNVNLSSPPLTTQGLTVEKIVQNKFFPVSSDYTVSNTSYMTFNNGGQTGGESSITFDLALAADSKNRMDGVNVYFESPSVGTGAVPTDGSNIPKVRIGTYTMDETNEEITLIIDVSGNDGGILRVLNSAGTDEINFIGNPWGNYDMANISFKAYRDARVESTDASYNPVSTASDPEESDFYVESGSQSTFGTSSDSNPIWNIPRLTTPGEDGGITLSGGVINTDPSSNHFISWTAATDQVYTYNLEMFKDNDLVTAIQTNNGLTTTSKQLFIDLTTTAKYTVNIRKVFEDEISEPTVIVFHTIRINTSNMAVSVINPSNTSSVKLSWFEPDISGNSVQSSESSFPSFANNISTQYIKYSVGSSGSYARLDEDEDADDVEASPKSYTLPSEAVPGTLLEFVMFIEANVSYTVDGVLSSTNSTSHDIPLTSTTDYSKYIVSSIPSVDVIPNSDGINIVPVLVQGSSNPTLLLNLNANGLETEGFISVVVILTQDGSDTKPEGEQALLIFPDSNNNHPFSFPNTVAGVGVLAGGDSAISAPRNELQPASSLSTHNNNYTLTIGTVQTTGEDAGRYGLSTLQMPSSANSGFVGGSPVNYMVILTTRRGTDIGVGEFVYEDLPSVENVEIVTIDGQYFVNFVINPA